MVHTAKPQRGGKGIPSNTNNSPQDPPPTKISQEPTKVTLVRRVVTKIQSIFRRK